MQEGATQNNASDSPNQHSRKGAKLLKWVVFVFLFMIVSILAGSIKRSITDPLKPNPSNTSDKEWASSSYGFAPYPKDYNDPVIQIYSARTRGPKKALAVHTWIATKRTGADHYMITQVFGWRLRRRGTALFNEPGIPDKAWYRNEPHLLLDLRGPEVELLIDKVEKAVKEYPFADEYTVWPGPNSNTFIAWLGLEIPELRLDLPSTAIGKDWRPISRTFGSSASGTGIQASIYGLLGITLGYEEGLELNFLGLSVELDVFDMSMELPGIGRVW